MTGHGSLGPIDVALLEFPDQTPMGQVAAKLIIEQPRQLAGLRDRAILTQAEFTQAEFEAQKARILTQQP